MNLFCLGLLDSMHIGYHTPNLFQVHRLKHFSCRSSFLKKICFCSENGREKVLQAYLIAYFPRGLSGFHAKKNVVKVNENHILSACE